MINESPILITGIPRSGASVIAGVIHLCGAFGGDMSIHNEVYENGAIQKFVEGAYLESIGMDPMGQYPLPEEIINLPANWRKLVTTQLLAEGYTKGLWMYKSARACLLWRLWANAFSNAKWIIVRRRTGDIIESCCKTGYMTAFKDVEKQKAVNADSEEAGWLWMVHEYEKRFVEMITEGLNCKVIWPERMVNGDYQQIYEALDWLGLTWKPQVLSFVDPLLWSVRNKERRK